MESDGSSGSGTLFTPSSWQNDTPEAAAASRMDDFLVDDDLMMSMMAMDNSLMLSVSPQHLDDAVTETSQQRRTALDWRSESNDEMARNKTLNSAFRAQSSADIFMALASPVSAKRNHAHTTSTSTTITDFSLFSADGDGGIVDPRDLLWTSCGEGGGGLSLNIPVGSGLFHGVEPVTAKLPPPAVLPPSFSPRSLRAAFPGTLTTSQKIFEHQDDHNTADSYLACIEALIAIHGPQVLTELDADGLSIMHHAALLEDECEAARVVRGVKDILVRMGQTTPTGWVVATRACGWGGLTPLGFAAKEDRVYLVGEILSAFEASPLFNGFPHPRNVTMLNHLGTVGAPTHVAGEIPPSPVAAAIDGGADKSLRVLLSFIARQDRPLSLIRKEEEGPVDVDISDEEDRAGSCGGGGGGGGALASSLAQASPAVSLGCQPVRPHDDRPDDEMSVNGASGSCSSPMDVCETSTAEGPWWWWWWSPHDEMGVTALHRAMGSNHPDALALKLVMAILDFSTTSCFNHMDGHSKHHSNRTSPILVRDRDGFTPLSLAIIKRRNPEFLASVLAHRSIKGRQTSAVFSACVRTATGGLGGVECSFGGGGGSGGVHMSVAEAVLGIPDAVYGRVPLHWACSAGDLAMVKYLVKSLKARVEVRDVSGYTPVMVAYMAERHDVVQWLREECGCDLGRVVVV